MQIATSNLSQGGNKWADAGFTGDLTPSMMHVGNSPNDPDNIVVLQSFPKGRKPQSGDIRIKLSGHNANFVTLAARMKVTTGDQRGRFEPFDDVPNGNPIQKLFPKQLSREEFAKAMRMDNAWKRYAARIVGFLMIWGGLLMLLYPLAEVELSEIIIIEYLDLCRESYARAYYNG